MPIEIEESDDLTRLESEWDALADEANAPPFLRPGWFRAWFDAFGSGRPWFLTARDRGRVCGVLPLERARLGVRAPANWHTPAFAAVVTNEGVAGALLRYLLAARPPQVAFSFVSDDSAFASVVRGEASWAAFKVLDRTLERSPYVDVNGAWDEYEADLNRKFRSELRRRRRKLEAEGELRVDVVEDDPNLDALLDEGLRVEASGWKGEEGTAIGSSPQTLAFYRAIVSWAASRSWLRLAFLRLSGKAIAFDLSLEDGGCHYLLKTGYDPSYAKLGPGQMIRFEMLKRAFEEGLTLYDFLGTDAAWKMEWTSHAKARQRLQLFAPTPAGRAAWSAYAYGRPVAKKALETVRSIRR